MRQVAGGAKQDERGRWFGQKVFPLPLVTMAMYLHDSIRYSDRNHARKCAGPRFAAMGEVYREAFDRMLQAGGSSAKRAPHCPCGEIGRRVRLKIGFRKECWFDSGQGHHFPTFAAWLCSCFDRSGRCMAAPHCWKTDREKKLDFVVDTNRSQA